MTYRFVSNSLSNCATVLVNKFWKENIYKIMIDFIDYFDKNKSQYGDVP